MKRLRTLFCMLALLISVSVSAKHLEFMGIPIAGTITAFQSKLQSKGFKISKNNSAYGSGIRAFSGVFGGENCEVLVWYDSHTKNVYEVRAIAELHSSEAADSQIERWEGQLRKKYKDRCIIMDEPSEGLAFEMGIFDGILDWDDISTFPNYIGVIYLHTIDYGGYPAKYGASITYIDGEGMEKHDANTLQDF